MYSVDLQFFLASIAELRRVVIALKRGGGSSRRHCRAAMPRLNPGETKRLFVAISPPGDILQKLQAATAAFAQEVPPQAVRWTHLEKLHLTLNFLGAIEVARIPEIQSALNAACKGHPAHEVQIAGLGAFPARSRPQIIWAGLAGDLRALESLKRSIDTHFAACGYVGETRPFRPHLTLGRASAMSPGERKKLAKVLNEQRACGFGPWQIERVDLMQSVLSAEGAAYTTLESIALEKP